MMLKRLCPRTSFAVSVWAAFVCGPILATSVPAWSAEQILVPQLPGWKVIDHRDAQGVEVNSLIPSSETDDTWTRRLTVQAYRGSPMTATAFLEGLVERIDEVCDSIGVEPIVADPPGPNEGARRVIACGRYKGDGMGSYTLYYALRGRDALYILARSWRGEPFIPSVTRPVTQAELARWQVTFDAVRLCDAADPNRPCPAP